MSLDAKLQAIETNWVCTGIGIPIVTVLALRAVAALHAEANGVCPTCDTPAPCSTVTVIAHGLKVQP